MSEPTELQVEIITRLARMEGKIDSIVPTQVDHEQRLRKLETSRSEQKGYIAGVSALVSVIVGVITFFFSH